MLMLMTDLRTPLGDHMFAVRSVLLCQRDSQVLLETGPYPFRNFPGGAAKLGETLREAAAREWQEETGLAAGELRPVALVENFFELQGQQWHELGFYYAVTAPADWPSESLAHLDHADNRLEWGAPDDSGPPIYPAPALAALNVPKGEFLHLINPEGQPSTGPDLRFNLHGTGVQVRVHLLYVQDGCLLTNKVPNSGYWFLIGGSVAVGEDSHAAALREFYEETGVQATSARLVGLTEAFDHAEQRQQLGLCYLVEAAQPLPLHPRPVADHAELWLEWVPLGELQARRVLPLGLERMLSVPMGRIEHFVV